MGRPAEYDEQKALDRAMLVFWQRGYAGTSISDLEEATGMKRQSLYNAFGDKMELYSRALDRYRERAGEAARPLASPDAGLTELRESMAAALQLQRGSKCGPCMIVKTAFDQQVDDPEIRKAAQEGAVLTRKMYERVLRSSQARGELDKDADPAALAGYLFSMINGLSALAQTGGSKKDVERALDVAFDALPRRRRRRKSN